jgi:hypothetical protein
MVKPKVTSKFITILSIVSILGFLGIVTKTLFDLDIGFHVEALWMFILGIGFLFETNKSKIKTLKNGINPNNFAHLTTLIIGIVAILAGFLSFPGIRVSTPAFLAIKGIISIIAIIVIIIQTWVIDSNF